jgi:hypothetical protein
MAGPRQVLCAPCVWDARPSFPEQVVGEWEGFDEKPAVSIDSIDVETQFSDRIAIHEPNHSRYV